MNGLGLVAADGAYRDRAVPCLAAERGGEPTSGMAVRLAVFSVCMVCCFAEAISAESKASPVLPAPLGAMPSQNPAMQCTAESLAVAAPANERGTAAMRDSSCLVGADAVNRSAGWSAVIDLRESTDFSRHHLPGAINLRLSEINAKPLPRDGELLVVGYGRVAGDAEQICYLLRKGGFRKARVLADGFYAWSRTQAGSDLRRDAEISSSDFIAEATSGTPLVVVLAPGFPEQEFGQAVLRTYGTHGADTAAIAGAIRNALAPPSGRKPSRVILVGIGKLGDAAMASLLADRSIAKPVFFVAAGEDELRQAFAMQRAMWAKVQKGPNTRKGCSAS